MNLDLDELIAGWDCPEGEIAARVVHGYDDAEVLQLRVDMGLLQMSIAGRPDGERYRGRATVLEYVRDEIDAGRTPADCVWDALTRELTQFNYRRLALTHLAEDAAHEDRERDARVWLPAAVRDIDHCILILKLLAEHREEGAGSNADLAPTLVFNRARLIARLYTLDQRYEDAVEELSAGVEALQATLRDLGADDEQCDSDPGVEYLRQMEARLRRRYGVTRTLHEQLDAAIEAEDFETAARLRDALRRRCDGDRSPPTAY
ncbi:MAG: hypothetical protein D6744_09770 [Planctomycetota bacterium]|nr:MAG: hypothetical protein D6744_09770 [Planctomycetota bacterium]